jgi:hypothetical protein
MIIASEHLTQEDVHQMWMQFWKQVVQFNPDSPDTVTQAIQWAYEKGRKDEENDDHTY